ncbi:activating signal cointegrator 1 complex subunit 3-like [Varroa destructor]|uniref:Activating signal cointegrator 1 complex subunit 3 n=1 Tax=Varroa destructor TaxID=109461 RepID=A0A7M7K9Y4_VARDE|nr:activating signal cointegrator 1 complex subunit 3-like [Varroa destructor]
MAERRISLLRPMPMEQLRFSGLWRGEAFYKTGLVNPPDFCQTKQQIILEESGHSVKANWQKLKDELSEQVRALPQSEITKSLRELQVLCQEALGDVDEATCQAAAIQLLTIFAENQGVLRNEDLIAVTCSVAPISRNILERIFEHVMLMRDAFGEVLGSVVQSVSKEEKGNAFLKEVKDLKFFRMQCSPSWLRKDFAFVFRKPVQDVERKLHFNDIVQKTNEQSGRLARRTTDYIDAGWLEDKVRSYMKTRVRASDMSPEEIVEIIMVRLESNNQDDVVSADLFEMLGIGYFDLISEVIKERISIVKAATKNAVLGVAVARNDKSVGLARQYNNPLGETVSVDLVSNIKIKKMMAKEEKKLQKVVANGDSDDLTINELRKLKQMELTERYGARSGRSSSNGVYIGQNTTMEETMPNVYDCMRYLRSTKVFVGGLNLVLPEGCQQIVKPYYDEIHIPVKNHSPPKVCPLISICSLDEILQMAFPNTEHLNLIQSAVYPVAYKLNDNMLICAPTGAGKTNVAMLTIMRLVRMYIDETINRVSNDFKIVYIAPMKALAGEMVSNFARRLSPFGVIVRELTGDMQLTKMEMTKTHMLITTPEKWDVVTRKGSGDAQVLQMVRLLILDEVHLLHSDRGPVLEALVARTLRQVESMQSMIRIIGLSATLPNYVDVANFLRVNTARGLFYFDHRFRPVPLSQTFIGIKGRKKTEQVQRMDEVAFEKAFEIVKNGNQVMVFVHSRNNTLRSAEVMMQIATEHGKLEYFLRSKHPQYKIFEKQLQSSRNMKLQQIFASGMGMHHAGMVRQDRNFVEKAFSAGVISVLFCTSTLAWGVNLPANCVIIKGTDIYDSQKGSFVDLNILDVQQIFGRAGRPQFQQNGEAVIITHHAKMSNYISLMTNQTTIESKFHENLVDNLIAEIVLGTVTTVDEAVDWLSYTYLMVRMKKNPLVYGITLKVVSKDPNLINYRRELIIAAAKKLDLAKMIRYHEKSGSFDATDLGRTASCFYIKYETVLRINEWFERRISPMQDGDVLEIISYAQEFDQLQLREDECHELQIMERNCKLPLRQGVHGTKVNTLIQNYISRGNVETFSLVSDSNYIAQNATRIARGLFEMALRKGNSLAAWRFLMNAKMLERQIWHFDSPLRQFPGVTEKTLQMLKEKHATISHLRNMTSDEVGQLVYNKSQGRLIHQFAQNVPFIEVECSVQPITRTVLRVSLNIMPAFVWDDHFHHNAEAFWIWVEDPESENITHSEYLVLKKKQIVNAEPQNLVFPIPVSDPLPSQYLIHVDSDRWLGSDDEIPMPFEHLILPSVYMPHTELLDLQPLPKTALKNELFESLYHFTHFNPIQTQLFHTLYHTDHNVLLGAPTGSGKTITAEIAMFRVFNMEKHRKVVYIAPLKSLIKERVNDWNKRLVGQLGLNMAELTGDVTPDFRTIANADIIVTTPEKWDGVSRSWQTRRYVQNVALIVIDEIHLLGEDRGPVLEVIVSRTNFINTFTGNKVRIIGLSTALANARDLGDWLQISEEGLFNFKPSVRPVQLEVHVSGHPGKHYCPRMAIMNQPAYKAILQHSPNQPVLIFVSSRRQTRLTAQALRTSVVNSENPQKWLRMTVIDMQHIQNQIRDKDLRDLLGFGIGMHHAGLQEEDRRLVEELFLNNKIQVLIATATLAWGVNLPAHLVIVKGTEYFDAKTNTYVDYPITDVLQMIGRAGRPQFDTSGVAVVLVHDQKKNFYQKFLYEPFPVESSLLKVLPDHLNAEIVAGTLSTTQDCIEYMTWTFFFRRLLLNPSYYGLEDTTNESVNKFLSNLITDALIKLVLSHCIEIEEDERTLVPTPLAKIASYYYLSHETAKFLHETLKRNCTYLQLLEILCDCKEFAELPVRHNEDKENAELARDCRWGHYRKSYGSPHTKAFLLLQAHMEHCRLPCSDYGLDLKSVLDQVPRVIQAQIDILTARGYLSSVLNCITLIQTITQARFHDLDDPLQTLPEIRREHLYMFHKADVSTLAEAIHKVRTREGFVNLQKSLQSEFDPEYVKTVLAICKELPSIVLRIFLDGPGCQSLQIKNRPLQGPVPEDYYIKVKPGEEYLVSVELTRLNSKPGQRGVPKAAMQSRTLKWKNENWFIILGHKDSGELYSLKRLSGFYHTMTHQLIFRVPESINQRIILTVFVASDTYLGLDQEYNLYLEPER